MKTYIDTTVLSAFYCSHPASHEAEAALRACETPVVSQISELELCDALGKRARRGELKKGHRERVLRLYRRHLEQGVFESMALRPGHQHKAALWLTHSDLVLSLSDALHLAMAAEEDLRLLTLDPDLRNAAEALGISIFEARPEIAAKSGDEPWASWES